ncbi:hypothetical protein QTP88_003381 [Uroleucon formosanum]
MQPNIQTNISLSGFFGKIRTVSKGTAEQTVGENFDKKKKSKSMNKTNMEIQTCRFWCLHPKKWMTYIPEIVTTMDEMEMETTNSNPLIENFTKLLTSLRPTPKNEKVLQRAVDLCINHDWNGNVCYVSDVIVPPGRDGIIRFVDDICRYIEFYRVQPFMHYRKPNLSVRMDPTLCRFPKISTKKHIRRRIYACNLGSGDWETIM